ncbi:hypothetical protein F2Q69_00013887 [Brassica cretica]|uniref:Uncharacterized protein n=1 Tax=Brassica cretica TaxID=69181 RepID=A0A8S9QZ31_BRACR|nr:hypothetical protein F2Q69_00013887 [Brassica cretica]
MLEEIYRTLGAAEDRLDRNCDEIYFPWDIVGVENGYDEVNVQISAKIGATDTYPNRPRTSSSMAIGPQTSQARSLLSDQA